MSIVEIVQKRFGSTTLTKILKLVKLDSSKEILFKID